MPGRNIAIGDIHGCSMALAALVRSDRSTARRHDHHVGDYIDRGIDSKGVLDQLIALADRCRLVPLLGNHDEMMLNARNGKDDFRFWMDCGGDRNSRHLRLDRTTRSNSRCPFPVSRTLPAVLRDRFALLRSRQLQAGIAPRTTGRRDTPLAFASRLRAGTALLWQDRRCGPHASGRRP